MSHLSETHLDHFLKKWSTFYRKKSIPMSHFWKLGYFLFHNLVTLVTGHVIPGPDVATANCQPPPLLPNGERSTSPSTAEGSRNVRLKDFTKGTKNAPTDQYPTDHIPDLIMSEYFDQKYGKVARPTADCICRCGEVMLYLLRPLLMCV